MTNTKLPFTFLFIHGTPACIQIQKNIFNVLEKNKYQIYKHIITGHILFERTPIKELYTMFYLMEKHKSLKIIGKFYGAYQKLFAFITLMRYQNVEFYFSINEPEWRK